MLQFCRNLRKEPYSFVAFLEGGVEKIHFPRRKGRGEAGGRCCLLVGHCLDLAVNVCQERGGAVSILAAGLPSGGSCFFGREKDIMILQMLIKHIP